MERIRAATASVAIVSTNGECAEELAATVADDATSLAVYEHFQELISALGTTAPDVIILDDTVVRDAADDIRQIRHRLPAVQVLYLNVATRKREIELLRWGADDVVSLDQGIQEARVQASARRARTLNAQNRIAVGDIVFDRESRRVWCASEQVELTPHEFSVLDCLFWYTPKPVDFDTIARFMWGEADRPDKRALVRVYVTYLRKKLAASKSVTIKHTKGLGYAFEPIA